VLRPFSFGAAKKTLSRQPVRLAMRRAQKTGLAPRLLGAAGFLLNVPFTFNNRLYAGSGDGPPPAAALG